MKMSKTVSAVAVAIAMSARSKAVPYKAEHPKMPHAMSDDELNAALLQLEELIRKDEQVIALRREAIRIIAAEQVARRAHSPKAEKFRCE